MDRIKDLLFILLFTFNKKERTKLLDRWKNQHKLIEQMRTGSHHEAIAAINLLHAKRDYYRSQENDGSLSFPGAWTNFSGEIFQRVNWSGANLSGVSHRFIDSDLRNSILTKCDLQDTIFDRAKLDYINFSESDMQEVHMIGSSATNANFNNSSLILAHLHGADFSFANFHDTNLSDARMRETNLFNADLTNAKLIYADLTNANLEGAILNDVILGRYKSRGDKKILEATPTLPDGSRFSEETDLERFTNRYHPDFWRPKNPVIWGGIDGIPKRGSSVHLDLSSNPKY